MNNKKKLAVISSWKEACGIASYTECLVPEFEKYYNVDIFSLKTEILNNTNKNISKMGDELIKKIAEKIVDYDYVNIQFEVGLFGRTKTQVYNRLMKLVNASNNLIITFHSINLNGMDIQLKNFIQSNPIKLLKQNMRENYWPNFYYNVFVKLKNLSKNKNINVIVHNKRDRDIIKRVTGFKNVYDFPLALYNKEIRSREKDKIKAKNFKEKYNLAQDDKVIGLFGFVSLYKGHETAIKALKYLPDNYKVVIFGAQHPHNIQSFTVIDKYLERLLNLIENIDKEISKNKAENSLLISQRVIFSGSATDDEFIDAMMYSDFVVLPYLEVNQMGSGVAANALECKANILMSNTKCFHEIKKYFPNCFETFDIGNYFELSNQILNWKNDYSSNIERCLKYYNLENNILNYKKIFEGTK